MQVINEKEGVVMDIGDRTKNFTTLVVRVKYPNH